MLYEDYIAQTAAQIYLSLSNQKYYDVKGWSKTAVKTAKALAESIKEECGEEFFEADNQGIMMLNETLKDIKDDINVMRGTLISVNASLNAIKNSIDSVASTVSSSNTSSNQTDEE